MFDSRLFTSRIQKSCVVLLIGVAWAKCPAAEAASPSSAGWQPAGAASGTRTIAASSSPWLLPKEQNEQPAAPAATNNQNAPNPLRPNRPAIVSPREPAAFAAPENAKPLSRSQPSGNVKPGAHVQQHAPSAAIAQTAAVVPSGKPANTATRSVPQQRTANPRVSRSYQVGRSGPNSNPPKVWQRLNVAMKGDSEWDGEAENLPLPEHHGGPGQDPFGPAPQGYYLEGDDQNYPTCGPGGCGDACGCDDGVCEPGCGCGGGDECCGGECCNDCFSIGPGDPESCHSVRIRVPKWQELNFFGGVQGFKGPYDQTRDSGNFGFHEGFNAGFKIPYTYAGYQIGYQSAQSQLNGDKDTDIDESHTQHFTTFGLFRRTNDGLQFGTAWDVLVDQRFHARTFHQLRSEVSWMDSCSHEFGVSATVGLNRNELDDGDEEQEEDDDDIFWQASDQFLLFYRFHGCRGGEGRFYAGWTDDSDAILGADMLLPVNDRWSVQTGFTYLNPDARNGEDGASEEAWNIHLGMVWHWGCAARKCHDNPYRPLFNVADNGYLIVDSREND